LGFFERWDPTKLFREKDLDFHGSKEFDLRRTEGGGKVDAREIGNGKMTKSLRIMVLL
jgi:hypothetical protein